LPRCYAEPTPRTERVLGYGFFGTLHKQYKSTKTTHFSVLIVYLTTCYDIFVPPMKTSDAIARLNEMDLNGYYVYSGKDLSLIFGDKTPRAAMATKNRLVKNNTLARAAKGVYVYNLSRHRGINTLEQIAKTLRLGYYNYVSLESALSEWGAISQIPIDRLTVMTTGRSGIYETPFGTIEFTHTKRSIDDVLHGSNASPDKPLRFATKQAAFRDLKRVGRNVHLINMTEMEG